MKQLTTPARFPEREYPAGVFHLLRKLNKNDTISQSYWRGG